MAAGMNGEMAGSGYRGQRSTELPGGYPHEWHNAGRPIGNVMGDCEGKIEL